MADSPKKVSQEAEPTASGAPVPVGFFVAFVVLFYLSTLYLDGNAGGFDPNVYEPYASLDVVKDVQPKLNVDPRFESGKAAYNLYCVACHQANGAGSPGQFPPLAGSDWVNAEGPNRIVRLVLHGLTGPIVVSGEDWSVPAQMPPWGPVITDDEELAALLTYIRAEWGNSASPVTAEQVEAVRGEGGRAAPWTQEELFQTPEL